MSNVRRHRRRWREGSVWLIALLPWPIVACSQGMRLLPGTHGEMWMLWAMLALATFYSLMILIMWKPWKWEDQ